MAKVDGAKMAIEDLMEWCKTHPHILQISLHNFSTTCNLMLRKQV